MRLTSLSLDWCEGRTPTPDGFFTMRWNKTADKITYQIDVPAGYSVQVENPDHLNLVQQRFPHGKVNYGHEIEGGY